MIGFMPIIATEFFFIKSTALFCPLCSNFVIICRGDGKCMCFPFKWAFGMVYCGGKD